MTTSSCRIPPDSQTGPPSAIPSVSNSSQRESRQRRGDSEDIASPRAVASRLTAKAFDERAAQIGHLQIVDVRNPGEVAAGTIPNAITIPVGQLPTRLGELDPTVPTVVYCAGGYRSSVAASLLRQNGFTDVSDILGGFGAWEEAIQNT